MSTKVSTEDVNKLGYRYRPRNHDIKVFPGLTAQGAEMPNPTPVFAPVRLPTVGERLRMYEQAGLARQMYYDDLLADDDFLDDYDDVPDEGLSPHEEHEIKHNAFEAKKARKEAADKAKAPSATSPREPSSGDSLAAPKGQSKVIEGVSPSGEDKK